MKFDKLVNTFLETYQGSHKPNPDGPRAHDLLETDMAPSDIYTHPHFTFDISGNSEYQNASKDSLRILKNIKGNPNAEITIYRAAPKGSTINSGDWVTLSKKYAEMHSRHPNDPNKDMPIIAKKVKASDIRWDGNDANEFGYFPE
jgi:hypothetical protein